MTKQQMEVLCPLRYVMDIIGGKWKLTILCILEDKTPKRYSEIKRKIPDITNMMLSQSLKELEQYGIITRTQYNEVPPRVEYTLNEDTDEMMAALRALGAWGIGHMEKQEKIFACHSCKNE